MIFPQTLCSRTHFWDYFSGPSLIRTLNSFTTNCGGKSLTIRELILLVFDQHCLYFHCEGLVPKEKLQIYLNLHHLSEKLHSESTTQFLPLPFRVINCAKTSVGFLGIFGCSLLGPKRDSYPMYLSHLLLQHDAPQLATELTDYSVWSDSWMCLVKSCSSTGSKKLAWNFVLCQHVYIFRLSYLYLILFFYWFESDCKF